MAVGTGKQIFGDLIMRKYKKIEEKKTIVVVEHEVIESTTCDICGAETGFTDGYWDYNSYRSSRTEISCYYESDGSLTVYCFDICPQCFIGVFAETMKEKFGAAMGIE